MSGPGPPGGGYHTSGGGDQRSWILGHIYVPGLRSDGPLPPPGYVVSSSSWGARPWVSLRSGFFASRLLLRQLLECSLAHLALSEASDDTAWPPLLDLGLLLQWQQN